MTVANDEVRALLGIDAVPGTPAGELGLTPRVRDVLREPDAGRAVMAVVRERVLVVSARTVVREGRRLGTLLTVRDRTAVESLTRQLDAVRTMSAALRAQRHEFANRLHVLSGLVHSGQSADVAEYLDALLGSGPLGETLPDLGPDAVRDSSLRAFLSAKAAAARERGVTLVLGGGTWVRRAVAAPVDVTTVLGNLVDNAVDAAHAGQRSPRRVEVELIGVEDTLLITVADSGDGVAEPRRGDLFDEGVSTKEPGADDLGGRGVGLPLARQIARARGGGLRLTDPGAPPGSPAPGTAGEPGAGEPHTGEAASRSRTGAETAVPETDRGPTPAVPPGEEDRVTGGAVFVARLPGVLAADDAAADGERGSGSEGGPDAGLPPLTKTEPGTASGTAPEPPPGATPTDSPSPADHDPPEHPS